MNHNKKQCGTVVMNPIVPILGAIGLIGFGIFLGISVNSGSGILSYAFCGIFLLLSLFMLLTINQRIDYTSKDFIYRDMFCIKHHYEYAQIKKIKYGKDVVIYVGHRIIFMDSMATNGKKFARIAGQYAPKAEFITDKEKSINNHDSKLFNGNIRNPREFIFIYVLIGLLPVCLSIFFIAITKEVNLSELNKQSAVISSYNFDMHEDSFDRLSIRIDGNEKCFVTWKMSESSEKYADFTEKAAQNKEFDIYYLKADENEGEMRIYQMQCGDTTYISIEDENKDNRETRAVGLICAFVILLVWLLYVAVSTYVMCNAERFPNLIKLFVKPSYIISNKKK